MDKDSSLDNRVEEQEEEVIDRGLDEGGVVKTGAARSGDDVLLNGTKMFSVKMLKILEMGFEAD